MPFRLSPDVAAKIADLASDLDAHRAELSADYAGRTMRWRDGDEGKAARRWIDRLAYLQFDLDNFPEKPEG